MQPLYLQNRFLQVVGGSNRQFLKAVFASGLGLKVSPEGLLEHARLLAITNLTAPGVYRNLTKWKRILNALEQDPTGARAYASTLLRGGDRR